MIKFKDYYGLVKLINPKAEIDALIEWEFKGTKIFFKSGQTLVVSENVHAVAAKFQSENQLD